MTEILFTANKKIHESVDLNFQFQQRAFTRASEHYSKLQTHILPRRLAKIVRTLSSSDLMSGRRKRGALGQTKLASTEIYMKRAAKEDREGPLWTHVASSMTRVVAKCFYYRRKPLGLATL